MKRKLWIALALALPAALVWCAGAAAETLHGTVNTSSLTQNGVYTFSGALTINVDENKTIRSISGDDLEIVSSNPEATLTIVPEAGSDAVVCENITINANVSVSQSVASPHMPIHAFGSLTISGGQVDVGGIYGGIIGARLLRITGGTVTVSGYSDYDTMVGGTVEITGGTVHVTAHEHAIRGRSAFVITGGRVIAESDSCEALYGRNMIIRDSAYVDAACLHESDNFGGIVGDGSLSVSQILWPEQATVKDLGSNYYRVFSNGKFAKRVIIGPDSEAATLSFNMNGHGEQIPPQKLPRTGEFAPQEPPEPTEEGWTFAGWVDPVFLAPFDFSAPLTHNTSAVAQWKPDVSITLEPGRGSGDPKTYQAAWGKPRAIAYEPEASEGNA